MGIISKINSCPQAKKKISRRKLPCTQMTASMYFHGSPTPCDSMNGFSVRVRYNFLSVLEIDAESTQDAPE